MAKSQIVHLPIIIIINIIIIIMARKQDKAQKARQAQKKGTRAKEDKNKTGQKYYY